MKKPKIFNGNKFSLKRNKSAESEVVSSENLPCDNAEDNTSENISSGIEIVPKVEVIQEEVFVPDTDDVIVQKSLEIIDEIAKNDRITGRNQINAGNLLLKASEEVLQNKGRLEPFYVKNFANKYGLIVIGVMFLFTLITFSINGVAGLILFLLSCLLLVMRVVFKVDLKSVISDKKIAFNVVNEIANSEKPENTIILASNYSSSQSYNFNRFFKINTKALLVCFCLFFVITFAFLVTLSCGVNNLAIKVLTGLNISLFMLATTLFYGLTKGKNIKHGLNGVGLSLMIADYLNQHKNILGDNTKIVFCSFGGNVDSYLGSKAFIKQHFKNNGDYNKAVVIGIDSVVDKNVALFTKNKASKLANLVYEKLGEQGVKKEVGVLKGYSTNLFEKVGVDSVNIGESQLVLATDFNTKLDDKKLDKDEAMEYFYKYLAVVEHVINNFDKLDK